MSRAIVIPGFFTALILTVIAFAAINSGPVRAETPDFRIIDVRAQYGQMIVEVQHFNPDGSHWFYEDYTFQGREELKRPIFVDADGHALLASGAKAPSKIINGRSQQFVPPGAQWRRAVTPSLDKNSILSVIQQIHGQREITGWTRGKQRLTVRPLDGSPADRANAASLAARFSVLTQTAYITGPAASVFAYAGNLPPIDPFVSSEWGTVSTFFPDGDPESTSVDGFIGRDFADSSGELWATIRDTAAGTIATDNGVTIPIGIESDNAVTDDWTRMDRGVFLFDTSALPDGDIVTSATFDLVLAGKTDNFSQSMRLVTSNPASNTALATGDYDALGTVAQATDLTITSLNADASTFNLWTLNSTGLANISLTSITKFGMKVTADADDSEPTWAANEGARIDPASAEEVLSGDKRPRLVVTHVAITAAITGTIGDGATELEVRDGGGTIIVTLTDDTWIDPITAQRQAIIDGLDAAESETNGWNAQVRDQLSVTAVLRTSSTIVTVTVSAAAVFSYQIDANEVITTTVPNAALVISGGDITGSPTSTITAVTESAAISGTLGGSGGVPAEIVAGGETVVITLSNTSWAESGATFDAARQGILDGLVSDGADQNGWNSLAFAVGDVARTSGSVVTITLTAEAAYAIPALETITTTVPASAVGGGALSATPTFAITPSFQTSGTRVSAAIDLSSVTDLAYCAIGWESILPANTTVAVATSVDGGTTFSEASNGSCPTGLTIGESLASITDFRIRATLGTTDTSATPLITALALLVEDSSGQDLYYQLNTTPSAILTDRSSNSNTGTMSFPIAPSGITISSDPLESTEAPLTTQQALPRQEFTSAVSGAATSGNIFGDETGFDTLGLQGIVEAMAGAGDGLPIRFVWYIFLGIFVIGVGMLMLHLTGDLLISAAAMAGMMGLLISIGDGLLEGWILWVFLPLAGSFLMFRRGFPL